MFAHWLILPRGDCKKSAQINWGVTRILKEERQIGRNKNENHTNDSVIPQ